MIAVFSLSPALAHRSYNIQHTTYNMMAMSAGRALMGKEKNSVQGLLRKTVQKKGDPKYEKNE